MNLVEGLLEQMNRCRELAAEYDKIPAGTFGAMMIRADVKAAEQALGSGDAVEMLRCFETLKNCE